MSEVRLDSQAFSVFVNENRKSPEFISLFIDENLRKNLKGVRIHALSIARATGLTGKVFSSSRRAKPKSTRCSTNRSPSSAT